jgi:cyclase
MQKRLLTKLEVKNNFLIKAINYEGLRKIGNPNEFAKKYYEQGVDEIIFIDIVASLYGRDCLFDIIEKASKDIFVPITAGGGIKTSEDIKQLLNSGADKVAINTSLLKNPKLINQFVNDYGSQCIVASIQAKKIDNTWYAYVENGKDNTNVNVMKWIDELTKKGVGEILLTSVDKDGTETGPDIDLIKEASTLCKIPLIVAGGISKTSELENLNTIKGIDGISISSSFHYDNLKIVQAKSVLL